MVGIYHHLTYALRIAIDTQFLYQLQKYFQFNLKASQHQHHNHNPSDDWIVKTIFIIIQSNSKILFCIFIKSPSVAQLQTFTPDSKKLATSLRPNWDQETTETTLK